MTMKVQIDKNDFPFGIEVKRFYAPFILRGKCPNCGEELHRDLSDHYLMYPPVNKPFKEYLYCEGCDIEHEVKLIMSMDMKVVEE